MSAETFFHGTRSALTPGSVIVPGDSIGLTNWPGMDVGGYVWVTRNFSEAADYARLSCQAGEPVVYEVEPIGWCEDYAELNGWDDCDQDEWITESARVLAVAS